jgi:hypothetical protein
MSIALNGQVGELRMTVQVTRAATGETEEVEMVGFVDENKLAELKAAGLIPETPKEQ